MAVLTIFAIPKPFTGEFAHIQRNAIHSWTRLGPLVEIILFGNETGTAEIAAEFGLQHVATVARNDSGTPLVSDLFDKARRLATHNLLCYVNADIVFTGDLLPAVREVARQKEWFLMAGQRWDLDIKQAAPLLPGWQARWIKRAHTEGRLHPITGLDYFVFPRDLAGDLPPLAIGRAGWDNWFLYHARKRGAALVDATACVTAIHQNHGYSHHPDGKPGVYQGPEAQRNFELAGGQPHCFTLRDATHVLTTAAERSRGSLTLQRCTDDWHVSRYLTTLPELRPWTRPLVWLVREAAKCSSPLRTRLGLTLPDWRDELRESAGAESGSREFAPPPQTPADRRDAYPTVPASSPHITIGITCYNEGDWLLECWQSVLKQTDDRWTAVLVMDGTTHERTKEVFRQLDHPKLRKVALPENVGPYPTRNKAFELTETPFHFYLDADDQLPPDAVKSVLETFEKQPEAGIVFGDYEYFGATPHVKKQPAHYSVANWPQGACAYRKDVWERLGGFAARMPTDYTDGTDTAPQNIRVIRVISGPKEIRVDPVLARGPADYDFHLSAIEAGVKGVHCGRVFYRRRTGHPSVSGSYRKELHAMVEIIARRHPKMFTEQWTKNDFLALGYKRAAIANQMAGERWKAARLACGALRFGRWRDRELWGLVGQGLVPTWPANGDR